MKSSFIYIAEDLKLNAQVFHWPEHIMNILELNQSRLAALR
jgi:hypothetical protein